MAGLLEGVLPALYSGADQVKRRVKGLLSDPRAFLGGLNEDAKTASDQRRAAFYQDYGKDAPGGLLAKSDPAWVQQQAELGRQQYLDAAMAGLTVWHGSPHKFDKFDMSKIGTGEGAQAYGHGLYFAEAPEVAKSYADNLAPGKTSANRWLVNDRPAKGNVHDSAAVLVAEKGADGAAKHLEWMLEQSKSYGGKASAGYQSNLQKQLDLIRSGKVTAATENTGALYKVDLPDSAIEKMLDWDKPLSQQAPEVRAALEAIGDETLGAWKAKPAGSGWDLMQGVNAYDVLAGGRHGNPAGNVEAARKLRAAGVPGIRYLDGGSRGAGTGTRNFVVFDDQLPKILEVNGGLLGR